MAHHNRTSIKTPHGSHPNGCIGLRNFASSTIFPLPTMHTVVTMASLNTSATLQGNTLHSQKNREKKHSMGLLKA